MNFIHVEPASALNGWLEVGMNQTIHLPEKSHLNSHFNLDWSIMPSTRIQIGILL